MSEAANESTGSEGAADATSDASAEGEDRKGSKAAVLADLAKERKARQALEGQVAELAPLKEQMAALAAAFGVKTDAGEVDALTQVQEQLAQMQRENAVFRVAAEHGITDTDDLDLLRSATDEQAMSKLAGRLAAKADSTPGTPKPDATQGGSGDNPKPETAPGMARLRQAYADTAK